VKRLQKFTIPQPLPVARGFFHDVPTVGRCVPGAEYLGPRGGNKHLGNVTSKIDPFKTGFEGGAAVNYDEVEKSVRVEGQGYDEKSSSRSKMAVTSQLSKGSSTTVVCVSADIQRFGKIPQLGRTGLITKITKALVLDFVRNTETELRRCRRGRKMFRVLLPQRCESGQGNSSDPACNEVAAEFAFAPDVN